jgi:hypothetical protein
LLVGYGSVEQRPLFGCHVPAERRPYREREMY